MRLMLLRPKGIRNHSFVLLPVVGYERDSYEFTMVYAWLFWGIALEVEDRDIDKFDNFMSNLFKKTSPKMWFTILISTVILLNLCL